MFTPKYIIFFIFVLHVGYACDCGYNTNSLIENYNSFNAVFKGKVVSIDYIETNNKKYDQITFSVFKNFKGAENKQIIVYEDSYSNCSIKFNIGEEWFVWANIGNIN